MRLGGSRREKDFKLRTKNPTTRDAAPVSFVATEARLLGDEKDFLRVGITHFRSRRETADVHVTLIRCIRARDEPGLVRHWYPVRDVALSLLHRCRGRR